MTDEGLQRLTQSRCWASSGMTDDVEDAYWFEGGARWANKTLRNDELYEVQMRLRRMNVVGVQTLQFLNLDNVL